MNQAWLPPTRHKGYIGDHWDEDDPVLSSTLRGEDRYAPIRNRWLSAQKKYGTDRYMSDVIDELTEDETAEFDPEGDYTNSALAEMADELLRSDSKREMCRRCGNYGDETGHIASVPQEEDGEPKLDSTGNQLYVDFPELQCKKGHRWFKGEGKPRGIDGKHPILFENHLQERRRREIYTQGGTPDPSIVQGMYNRTHPQGRKVNSPEQRKRNGASWYR